MASDMEEGRKAGEQDYNQFISDGLKHFDQSMAPEYPRVDYSTVYERNNTSPTNKSNKSGLAPKDQSRY